MLLRSDDPWDAPKLDIGYLTDKEGADLATLRCAPQEIIFCPSSFVFRLACDAARTYRFDG